MQQPGRSEPRERLWSYRPSQRARAKRGPMTGSARAGTYNPRLQFFRTMLDHLAQQTSACG
jgi:hypothetical protein